MSKFAEQLKQSLDSRLPHFSTSLPYIIATILIMLIPLTVSLSQQETRTRSQAAAYTISVYVRDSSTDKFITNADVSVSGQTDTAVYSCNTSEMGKKGYCDVSVSNINDGKPYTINASAPNYDPGTTSITLTTGVQANSVGVSLDPAPEQPQTNPPQKQDNKLPSEKSPPNYPNQQRGTPNEQTPSDDTNDPNTGGPNDTDTPDDGSNPPSPDDLKCLGSCETPTPTPPYCITPAPTGEEPEDTGTPSPDTQSIFDMVRQRINEAFSRFGDLFNGRNPGSPSEPSE